MVCFLLKKINIYVSKYYTLKLLVPVASSLAHCQVQRQAYTESIASVLVLYVIREIESAISKDSNTQLQIPQHVTHIFS